MMHFLDHAVDGELMAELRDVGLLAPDSLERIDALMGHPETGTLNAFLLAGAEVIPEKPWLTWLIRQHGCHRFGRVAWQGASAAWARGDLPEEGNLPYRACEDRSLIVAVLRPDRLRPPRPGAGRRRSISRPPPCPKCAICTRPGGEVLRRNTRREAKFGRLGNLWAIGLSVTLVKLPSILLLALSVVSVRAADLPPINVKPSGLMLPGKMIWADLFTKNPTAEVQFYTGLFGWKAATVQRPSGATYIVLSADDVPVAGVIFRDAPQGDTGQGRWINYLTVADVDKTVAAATALGGQVVHPARLLASRGTQALLTDNQGSLIGIIHSSTGDPDDTEPAMGMWAWAHLSARDPAAASQFYHAVFGQEVAPDIRDGQTTSAFLLSSQGFVRASIGPIPARPEAKPEWLGFVRVANLDDAIAKATSLGARVLLSPMSPEPQSRLAILADPAAVAIGIVELTNPTALDKQK